MKLAATQSLQCKYMGAQSRFVFGRREEQALSALTAAVQRFVERERGAAEMIHRNCCMATEIAVDQIVAVQLREAPLLEKHSSHFLQRRRRGCLEDGVQAAKESIYLEVVPGGRMMGEKGAGAAEGADSCWIPDHYTLLPSSIASAEVPGVFASERISRSSRSSSGRSPNHASSFPAALEKELAALAEQSERLMWSLAPLSTEKAEVAGRLAVKVTRLTPSMALEVDPMQVESIAEELRGHHIEASSLFLSLKAAGLYGSLSLSVMNDGC